MTATAQIFGEVVELPAAARMRARLAELEAATGAGEQPSSRVADLEKQNEHLTKAAVAIAQMLFAVQASVDGMEEMCNTEKARGDEAEARARRNQGDAIVLRGQVRERDDRLAAVALEIDGLQAELSRLRAEAQVAQQAHEAGVAVLRELLARRQAELEAAAARAEALEKQIADITAAHAAERITDAKRALQVAVGTCASVAEARAEGWAIAMEIRAILGEAG